MKLLTRGKILVSIIALFIGFSVQAEELELTGKDQKINFNELINNSAHEKTDLSKSVRNIVAESSKENLESNELLKFYETEAGWKQDQELVDGSSRLPNSVETNDWLSSMSAKVLNFIKTFWS